MKKRFWSLAVLAVFALGSLAVLNGCCSCKKKVAASAEIPSAYAADPVAQAADEGAPSVFARQSAIK
ncbi:MAG: hypothetical protein HY588_03020 [Candidatus Omnitrophica bacterium]|nr:hypothetical protein [Candidatus Omnitrophota bacterium]